MSNLFTTKAGRKEIIAQEQMMFQARKEARKKASRLVKEAEKKAKAASLEAKKAEREAKRARFCRAQLPVGAGERVLVGEDLQNVLAQSVITGCAKGGDNEVSFKSVRRGVRKKHLKALYSCRHFVRTFDVHEEIGKGIVYDFSYSNTNNSAMNRAAAEISCTTEGIIDIKDDENNTAYVVKLGKKAILHNAVVKINFSEMEDNEVFMSSVKNSILAIDLENNTCREVSILEPKKDGETLFRLGSWTPSSEKGYSVLFYALSEEEIIALQDEVADYAFSDAEEKGINIKSFGTRFTTVSAANAVCGGDLIKFINTNNASIMFIDTALDSVIEVDEASQAKLKLSNEGPDGMMYMNASIAKWILSNATGSTISRKEAVRTNFQARIGHEIVKAFAMTMDDRAMEIFAKGLKERYEGHIHILGNGPVALVIDANAAKVKNMMNGVTPERMNIHVLDIADTSKKASLSSQLYINICNTEYRDAFDEYLLATLDSNIHERVANALDTTKALSDKPMLWEVGVNALGLKAFKSTFVRKNMLKSIDNMLNGIVEDGKVDLNGFYEHAVCDPFNALTNGVVENILGLDGNKFEVYSQHAETLDTKVGVMKKFPAQGMEEFVLVKFVSYDELVARINKLTDDEAIRKAVKSVLRTLGAGTIMIPASALIKEHLAGMDFDYDAVMVYTDEIIVEAISKRLDGVSMRACAIRYADEDAEALVAKAIKAKVAKAGMSKGAQKLKALIESADEEEATPNMLVRALEDVAFGSVIGKTVSASDMAITLDDRFMFDSNGKLNTVGKETFSRVFASIGVYKEDGHDYAPIFVAGENYVSALINIINNSNAEVYIVNSATVDKFIQELFRVDLDALTIEGFKSLRFELSFIARALGESSIDILKKGAEVDLGYKIEDVIIANSRLSKALAAESNIDDFLNKVVYNVGEEANKEYKIEFFGSSSSAVQFVEGTDNRYASEVTELDKNGKKKKITVIDKFGVLKIKLVRQLEASMLSVAGMFGGKPISSKDIWYNRCISTYKYTLNKIKVYKNVDEASAKTELDSVLARISALLNASRDMLFSRNIHKDDKTIIADVIASELFASLKGVVEYKDVVRLAAFAYTHNFMFRGVGKNLRSEDVKSKLFSPANITYYSKIAEEEVSDEKYDSAISVIFKVFGAKTALLFGDSIKAKLEVEMNSFFKFEETDDLSKISFSYIDERDEYGLYLANRPEAGYFGYFEDPEVGLLTDIYMDIEESDFGSKLVFWTEAEPTFSTSGRRIVVLDKLVGEDGKGVLASCLYTAREALDARFSREEKTESGETVRVDAFDFENTSDNKIADNLVGKHIYMPNYYAGKEVLDKNKFLWDKYSVNTTCGKVGNAIFTNDCTKGIVELAMENILIIK